MEKAEWAIVEENLKTPHHPVALECDGYHVTFILERIAAMKMAICVYVNGKMQLHTDERAHLQRFHYPSKRSVMSAADKRDLAKEPKWLQKKLKATSKHFDPTATYTVYKPFWGSFKALKSHLVKHNQGIHLLKTWQYTERGHGTN